MNLPKITERQRNILDLLYEHRFLNRIQIQALLDQKDYKNTNLWLKDLREKQYVEWIYSTHFAEKTKPATYYLGINGIRRFRQHNIHGDHILKYYRESTRSQAFIDRCILLTDACVAFKQANRILETELRSRQVKHGEDIWFRYETEAEYTTGGYYTFLTDTDIHPHLVYAREKYGEEVIVASYTVEVFDPTIPRYTMRKRLKNYVNFLDSEEWQSETEEEKPPIALFICPTKADMIYCKRATKKLLADAWDTEHIHMRFATVESVQQQGFRWRVWEEVVAPEDDD
jgi:protein involved in plasmid replication-relaxation